MDYNWNATTASPDIDDCSTAYVYSHYELVVRRKYSTTESYATFESPIKTPRELKTHREKAIAKKPFLFHIFKSEDSEYKRRFKTAEKVKQNYKPSYMSKMITVRNMFMRQGRKG